MEEIEKYDNNGNFIYYQNEEGYKQWYEYDENNRLTHHKDNHGIDVYYRYEIKIEQIEMTKEEFKEFKKYQKKEIPKTRFELIDFD
jgi:YD repeat-containing protein